MSLVHRSPPGSLASCWLTSPVISAVQTCGGRIGDAAPGELGPHGGVDLESGRERLGGGLEARHRALAHELESGRLLETEVDEAAGTGAQGGAGVEPRGGPLNRSPSSRQLRAKSAS